MTELLSSDRGLHQLALLNGAREVEAEESARRERREPRRKPGSARTVR